MTASEVVGERVHTLMWRRRLEQGTVSKALGITQSALSRKLRGDRPWTIEELIEAAAYFDVPVTDLLPAIGAVRQEGIEPPTRWFGALSAA